MNNSNTNRHKAGGNSIEDEPAAVAVTVGEETYIIDATHHIVSDTGRVSLYLGDRADGIDIQVIGGVVLCRSERARDRLNMNVGDGTDSAIEAHTGTHADGDSVQEGDRVRYDAKMWRVTKTGEHDVLLEREGEPTIGATRDAIKPVAGGEA
jgi:hypothetical protein